MYKQAYSVSLDPYLTTCSNLIAQKMNMPLIGEWPNADYIKLSSAIARETKVYISKNTLKRIFGKLKTDESYYPQKATLDALAVFTGYVNWDNFKSENKLTLSQENYVQNVTTESIPESKKIGFPTRNKVIFIGFAVAMVIITALVFLKGSKPAQPEVGLLCLNPEGTNRHSAIFKLQAKGGDKDTSTFTLDFDDRTKEPVKLNNQSIVHYFPTPGRYQIILNHKGKPIDTSIVCVKSKGWAAYINGPIHVYGRHMLHGFDGSLQAMKGFTNADVAKAGGDTLKPFVLSVVNIKKTKIDGDNFEMRARVKIADGSKKGRCTSLHFNIYGQVEDDYFTVTNPECVAWADANFSEQVNTGLWEDLRRLGKDLSGGADVILHVKNKQVRLSINDKLLYETRYNNKLGNISGVRIGFSGLGEVSAFSLRDLNSGETF